MGNLIKWISVDKLGHGSFGDVFKVLQVKTGKLMAVKRIPIDAHEPTKNAIKALKREIGVLKEVSHKNVVSYIGSEIISGHFYIYMDLASEGTLLKMSKALGKMDE